MIAHKNYLDTAHKSKLLSEQGARMHVSATKQALTTLNTLCCADRVKHPQPFALFVHSLHWRQKL
jgi:hypothetical protein